MLFQFMGQSIQFRLVEVSEKEKSELSQLIKANGGVVSENSLIKFTSRNAHIEDGDLYLVDFIYDCVKQNKILDITKYKYGTKGIGCPMSQLLTGSASCMAFTNMDATFCPSHQSTLLDNSVRIRKLVDDQVRIQNEHDYGDNIMREIRPSYIQYEEIVLPTTDTEGSIPDSMYYPDESHSQNSCLRADSNVENQETLGGELVTDVPSPARFEEKSYDGASNEVNPENGRDIENIHSQDDSDPIRRLGRTRIEDILRRDNFRLTSSDSDETIENASSWIECRRKKSYKPSSNDDTAWSSSQDEKATNVKSRKKDIRQQPSCSNWTGTKKFASKNKPSIQERLTRKSENEIIIATDSDSDVSEVGPNRLPNPTNKVRQCNRILQSTAKRHRPIHRNFDNWEQQEMVNYLIKNSCISEARGNRVWKQMIDEGLLKHRTVHSLNNHFRRYILPNIHLYRMSKDSREEFDLLKQ
ncbi:uncharacterized protein LOC124182660 isoform X1 [Neodiprion fabricii]|uniref:uncharacterized protein LOC124182660 isoform X1 n=1 Tax=Neodiprion fabricii TaxID=2872261 RepID=UPI001ED95A4D|nr:uncharacterized protein LOC124182660 isoform X1 [Neodiprion fabricii]